MLTFLSTFEKLIRSGRGLFKLIFKDFAIRKIHELCRIKIWTIQGHWAIKMNLISWNVWLFDEIIVYACCRNLRRPDCEPPAIWRISLLKPLVPNWQERSCSVRGPETVNFVIAIAIRVHWEASFQNYHSQGCEIKTFPQTSFSEK